MMLWLLIGAAVLFALLGGMRAFERASIRSIKALAVWIAALGGLSLALLLILTGRGGMALGPLIMFGPLVWRHLQAAKQTTNEGAARAGPRSSRRGSSMTRAEAFAVLGLSPGASDIDIKEAHIRLMRTAHPDVGGSDWIATRINQARDILLG